MQDSKNTQDSAEVVERFWRKVDKSDSCWNWTGKPGQDGYGKFYPHRLKTVRAHRYSYALTHGPISESELVCHSCDNRLCVNPAHLFVGSHKDNHEDRNRKNRQAKGENHGRSVLTTPDVLAIRKTSGNTKAIAKKYGVSVSTIEQIRRRDIWKHV